MCALDIAEVIRGRLPVLPQRSDAGIGIVGAGFIVRDCHLVAYRQAAFRVIGITSRTEATAREVAALRGVPKVFASLEALLDDPEISVIDVAVPPLAQPDVIRRILDHPAHRIRGILAQKPLAMTMKEARELVDACESAGVLLQVNQNMRYDQSVRALKTLLDDDALGVAPVLAMTIGDAHSPLDALGPKECRLLATFIMSIHHPGHLPLLAGRPLTRPRQHAPRPAHRREIRTRRRPESVYP